MSDLEVEVEQDAESKKLGAIKWEERARGRVRMKRLQMTSDAVQRVTFSSVALIITNSHFGPLLAALRCIS